MLSEQQQDIAKQRERKQRELVSLAHRLNNLPEFREFTELMAENFGFGEPIFIPQSGGYDPYHAARRDGTHDYFRALNKLLKQDVKSSEPDNVNRKVIK